MNSIVVEEPTEAAGTQRVLAFFREQFLLGRLKSGDRLQAERELSETLGVTRTVLREALRTLDNLGFLDIQYGKGTYVRNVDIAVLGDFLAFSLAQQPDIIDDIMRARVAIECQAIRLACTRATDGDFARIGGLLARLVETLDNADEGSASDYAFHLALVEASRSPALLTIYRSIRTILTGTQPFGLPPRGDPFGMLVHARPAGHGRR